MKRTLFQVILVSIFFLAIGFFSSYYLPQLKKIASATITNYSQKNLPVRITVDDFKLSLFPVGLSFENVRAIPKKELSRILAPVIAHRVILGVHPLSLFSGKKNILEVSVDRPTVTVVLRRSEEPDPMAPKKTIYVPVEEILGLPFHSIALMDTQLKFRSDDARVLADVKDFNLSAEYSNKAISIQLSTPQLRIKKQDPNSQLAEVSVETRMTWNKVRFI